jgi:hypothetical protein
MKDSVANTIAALNATGKGSHTFTETVQLVTLAFAGAAPEVSLEEVSSRALAYLAHVKTGTAIELDVAAKEMAAAARPWARKPSEIVNGDLGGWAAGALATIHSALDRLPPWLPKDDVLAAADEEYVKPA